MTNLIKERIEKIRKAHREKVQKAQAIGKPKEKPRAKTSHPKR